METYENTLKDCISELEDLIQYYKSMDDEFDVDDYIEDMDYQDDLYSIIDGCVSVYDSDIMDIFKSETKLKYMDDEFGGDTIIQKMIGIIHQSLVMDLQVWLYNEDNIEDLKELINKTEETNE